MVRKEKQKRNFVDGECMVCFSIELTCAFCNWLLFIVGLSQIIIIELGFNNAKIHHVILNKSYMVILMLLLILVSIINYNLTMELSC